MARKIGGYVHECPLCYFVRRELVTFRMIWQRKEVDDAAPCLGCNAMTYWLCGEVLPSK